MIDLVAVFNESTYQRLRDLFPDAEWHKHRDYWVAELPDDRATEFAKVATKAGFRFPSRPKPSQSQIGLRFRFRLLLA